MDRRNKTAVSTRKSRRRLTLLWVAIGTAVVITLLVMELVAVLYVLATLSVVALLIVVAFSDLRGARAVAASPAPFDDAAAISDGISPASTPVAAGRRSSAKNR